METKTKDGRIRRAAGMIVSAIALVGSPCVGQTPWPASLDSTPGVHVYVTDDRPHRDARHYAALCVVVNQEFAIFPDSLLIHVVFIDQITRDRMRANNPARFRGADWCGAFIEPSLILLLGEEESDDTFMHEYMHLLQSRDLIFRGAHPSSVHHLIEQTEGLLLGSKAYIAYLKNRRIAGK
jgi:hypothetical protein